jgi:hypothetical protein
VRVSQPSTFTPGCDGVSSTGTLYVDTAAEPYLAVNPVNPTNFIAAWQQNRWSDGGAQGLNLAVSFDAGATWTLTNAAFPRCTGGNSSNAGDFARATDVWLSVSPNGTMYALSLSFTGATLMPGSSSAMLVAQSFDGGMTWGLPVALISDAEQVSNDKGSITADPDNAAFAYAVWDRLTSETAGQLLCDDRQGRRQLAAGAQHHDPASSQTISQIVVLPSGRCSMSSPRSTPAPAARTTSVRAIQSIDRAPPGQRRSSSRVCGQSAPPIR